VYEFDQSGIARKVTNSNIIPVPNGESSSNEVTDDAA